MTRMVTGPSKNNVETIDSKGSYTKETPLRSASCALYLDP